MAHLIAQCVKTEPLAYEPFISAIKSFAPALSFVNTSNHADTKVSQTFSFSFKLDISVYADETLHSCDVSTAEVIIKFKWAAFNNAFCNPPLNLNKSGFFFINQTMRGTDTLGQITSYATAQLGAQCHTIPTLSRS
ncbi:hypothetical protein EDB19DRAFT_1915247 [Suillus lakei]|nr:hypothetical protein EDB19DRAFT_1915247 [Suillus lakei]